MPYITKNYTILASILTFALFLLTKSYGSVLFGILGLILIASIYLVILLYIRSELSQFLLVFLPLFILGFVSIDLSIMGFAKNYTYLTLIMFLPFLVFGIANKKLLLFFILLSMLPLAAGNFSVELIPRLIMVCSIFGAVSALKFSSFQKIQIYFIQSMAILGLVNLVLFFGGFYDVYSYDFGLAVPRMFMNWGGLNPNRSALLFGTSIIMFLKLPVKTQKNLRFSIVLVTLSLLATRSRNIIAFSALLGVYLVLKIYGIKALLLISSIPVFFSSQIYVWFLREQSADRIQELSSRVFIWSEIVSNLSSNSKLFFGYGAYGGISFWDTLDVDVTHAHNNYLQLVVESGIVGLLIFVVFVAKRLIALSRVRYGNGEALILMLLLVASISEPHINGAVSAGTYILILMTRQAKSYVN